jgi:predicted RNA-binding Zn-ribbon protein involved in translation (DUF1610 family)
MPLDSEKDVDCVSCGTLFKISYDENTASSAPDLCPFCGESILVEDSGELNFDDELYASKRQTFSDDEDYGDVNDY